MLADLRSAFNQEIILIIKVYNVLIPLEAAVERLLYLTFTLQN